MGLILHEEAKRERFNAIAWYEEDYPGRGRRFFDAVKGVLARIQEAPHPSPGGADEARYATPLCRAGCRRGGRIATIQLPRVKAWNVIAFRPAESAHADYSASWARAADGSLVALVLDFRLFG